jgi:predicted metal-dependent phosphotriesterase family hydrolase
LTCQVGVGRSSAGCAPPRPITPDVEQLADLFVADIEDGIDANDYSGPLVDRTPHKAGVIKVGGSDEWMAQDRLLGDIVLGMDAARRGYYAVYGGRPGLAWLLDGFSATMEERGIGAHARRQVFGENPARLFAFATVDGGSA